MAGRDESGAICKAIFEPILNEIISESADDMELWLRMTYACEEEKAKGRKKKTDDEPFALLHRGL